MFEDRAASLAHSIEIDLDREDELDLRSIIQRCTKLPAAIKRADITYTEERVLDRSLLTRLTNVDSLEHHDTESTERLRDRRQALSPYLGSILTCVFIRLPGVHYTIEVDPVAKLVVYWEWQQT